MSVSGYLSGSSKLACSPAIETLESSLQLSLSTLKASALTKLNETKNFNIVKGILKILCGDTTQPVKLSPIKTNEEIKKEQESPVYSPEKDSIDIHLKEESLVEIEGTPTGRTSPIIQPKKLRSTSNSTDFREKKKCPSDWHTPESKVVKLIYPSPRAAKGKNLRLKQTKIQLANIKKSNTIDLTSSPEFSGGIRGVRSESLTGVQTLIKKESIESEDTILPSPTSGPTNFSALYKSSKNSPSKFKPPLSLSKLKSENVPMSIDNNRDAKEIADTTNIEESINLLQPKRRNGFKRQSPIKFPFIDRDLTNCDTQNDESLSLLHHVNMLEADQENIGRKSPITSPTKRPLAENINVTNLQEDVHIESSMSLLSREIKPITEDKIKRRVPDPTEPLYKEPTVRKKAEKRALPGWSCDECKHFFAELYKDDPDMLAQKMDECSKHRGKQNPVRPKTPDGFWNPRWDVPLDTEEFNKRNNAV
ncbi:uncharacterized protein LOC106139004 isoform X2 [Amyelois transitella]|uniref:uncharacterized protein LOC106139004 isoform X2 n=1 Tax=Amyelois transitella TaxID=680683 RepID=UPI0029900886|nr:uncharacterized protein LOC106139004 isoform X2 [Amyelois transitella]